MDRLVVGLKCVLWIAAAQICSMLGCCEDTSGTMGGGEVSRMFLLGFARPTQKILYK